jgi:hypothetical protein
MLQKRALFKMRERFRAWDQLVEPPAAKDRDAGPVAKGLLAGSGILKNPLPAHCPRAASVL